MFHGPLWYEDVCESATLRCLRYLLLKGPILLREILAYRTRNSSTWSRSASLAV